MEIQPWIVVIAYNRERSLERLLNSVGAADYPENTEVPLIISIDKSDNGEVLRTAESFEWRYGPKRIEARPERLGLKRHVLLCGDYSLEYGSAVVLEDDLYVSPEFYRFAVSALTFSSGQERLGGISLYNHLLNVHAREPFYALDDGVDNYFLQFASSWGQAYTKKQWEGFKEWLRGLEEKTGPSSRGTSNALAAPAAVSAQGNWADTGNPRIPANVASWSESSWLKYHIAYLIEKDMYFLYPRVSLTTNFMSEGEHSREENQDLQVPLLMGGRGEYRFSEFSESEAVYDAFFENTGLKRIIGKIEKESFGNGLDSSFEDICIDLYGYRARTAAINNKNRNENGSQSLTEQSRYVLTSASLPYRVIKSYGLSLRPIDLNIITEQPGEVFFLYDTKEAGPAPKVDRGRKYLYDYRALSLKKIAAFLKTKVRMRK
ncbi:MAG: glycosyltransferase family 2 protein [Lachnospiraceae bacterium]|nr:glycosyltransferase family 2 protein [Lachnospiraceae bacterium]